MIACTVKMYFLECKHSRITNVKLKKSSVQNVHKIQETPRNMWQNSTKNLLQKHKRYHDETKRSFKCLLCTLQLTIVDAILVDGWFCK